MKIQKTKAVVKAADMSAGIECAPVCDNRASAIEFIQSAISALSALALENPEDVVVTDSIVNLGVVLLDLKSST